METTILYPFEPQSGNAVTFELALQMARKLRARVILFSVLPDNSTDEAVDQIQLHLLGLLGNYRTRHQAWKQRLGIRIERIIRRGDTAERLGELMATRKVDLVICQPHNLRLSQKGIRKHVPSYLLPELVDPYTCTGIGKS